MTSYFPSYFSSPLITTIPNIKYDDRGRQLQFVESEVQRLERVAFANASKSRCNSPTSSQGSASPSSSASPSPRMRLISEPFCDPIELMANKLAEEYFSSSDDFSSSSDEEPPYFSSSPSRGKHSTPVIKFAPASTFKPGHRRKRASLSSIPEED